MDIAQWDGEDQSPRHGREPLFPALSETGRTTSHDMVAMIDRLQERGQVRLAPRLLGGGHQHERKSRTRQPTGQCTAEVHPRDRDDPTLHRPPHRLDLIGQRSDDRLGTLTRQLGEQDDVNPGIGERLALEVAKVRIVDVLGRGHSGVRSWFCLRGSAAPARDFLSD
jgi:hypothetical protein